MIAPDLDALLFDKDGTLFDLQATWGAWCRAVLTDLSGGDPQRFSALADAVGFDRQTGRLCPGSIVVADTPVAIARAMAVHLYGWDEASLVAHLNSAAARAPQVEAAPLAPLIKELKGRGLALALVTNDAEAPARAHLAAAGILEMFDRVCGSDSGHGAKPDPAPLLAVCAAMGVAPGRCAMVGDSAHDMIAARAAGMVAVLVDSGLTTRVDVGAFADAGLSGIGDLPAWLDRA